jgi:hypothetical protein
MMLPWFSEVRGDIPSDFNEFSYKNVLHNLEFYFYVGERQSNCEKNPNAAFGVDALLGRFILFCQNTLPYVCWCISVMGIPLLLKD